MKRLVLAALGVLLAFSSCVALPGGSDDLLAAPRLNTTQAEMYGALEAAVNISAIHYKYPQSGNYRSPFVFRDLDGDGRQEAVVFYAYNSSPQDVRATVFKEEESGWQMVYDIPGGGDQVDFIRFANLLEEDRECMIVGWRNTGFDIKQLGVYSFTADGFRPEYVGDYAQYLTGVFDVSGLSRIVLARQVERGRAEVVLLGKGVGGSLQELDLMEAAEGVQEVLQIQAGTLYEDMGGVGIYMDELWSGNDVYTEVLHVVGDTLQPIATQRMGEDFTSTLRQYRSDGQMVLSTDINKNGIINIPVLYPLPGVEEGTELTPLMLTQLLYLTSEGFESDYAVINNADGYLVYFPDKWVDQVAVSRQSELREWRFYSLDWETGGYNNELLRIRVHDNRDYKDKFISDYILLAQSGVLEYYAYIPKTSDEALAITEAEAKAQFLLL